MTTVGELQIIAIFFLCKAFLIGGAVAMILCKGKDSDD